ncbi:hypothetical protein [Chryseobacterium mucoviscidosis]|uniref:hypothetical protein n=1 Tax=Chryseobacterium mucoviscidosis TaxID=1945581 RepID=UPI00301A3B4A
MLIFKITFEEYLALSGNHPLEPNLKVPLFRWDNYILNLDQVNPNFFGTTNFITKEPYLDNDFINYEYRIEEFLNSLHHWLEDSKNGCIINLDIDFFYSNSKGYYQLYSDELVRKVGNILVENMDKIDIITIALSPECCGGWENAFKTMKILDIVMDLEMDI